MLISILNFSPHFTHTTSLRHRCCCTRAWLRPGKCHNIAPNHADWDSESVDKSEILRLIYQGRFLHCNVTLGEKLDHAQRRQRFCRFTILLLFNFEEFFANFHRKLCVFLPIGALGLPLGKTTVMHLVPRDNLPEPNSQGEQTLLRFIVSSTDDEREIRAAEIEEKCGKKKEKRKTGIEESIDPLRNTGCVFMGEGEEDFFWHFVDISREENTYFPSKLTITLKWMLGETFKRKWKKKNFTTLDGYPNSGELVCPYRYLLTCIPFVLAMTGLAHSTHFHGALWKSPWTKTRTENNFQSRKIINFPHFVFHRVAELETAVALFIWLPIHLSQSNHVASWLYMKELGKITSERTCSRGYQDRRLNYSSFRSSIPPLLLLFLSQKIVNCEWQENSRESDANSR